MKKAIQDLDRLLRGDATRLAALRSGGVEVPASGLALVILALGVIYGVCMGSYGLSQKGIQALPQMISTAGKVPLLFLLTLIVTFPSLYVFNALVGSRLSLASVLRLILAALAVLMAVLASLGPIVVFFALSTTDYSFILLLNVAVFLVSGFLGLKFLLHTLHRLALVQAEIQAQQRPAPPPSTSVAPVPVPIAVGPPNAPAPNTPLLPPIGSGAGAAPPPRDPSGALEGVEGQALGPNVTTIFRIWIVVFGLVGAQMSWVLRPFLGAPNRPFEWFRAKDSNFFEAVLRALGDVLS